MATTPAPRAPVDTWFLVVGLGNPGADYSSTRHNAGFLAVETLAKLLRANWRLEPKLEARLARAQAGTWKALLCQPQTYMNESGRAVGLVGGYFKVPIERILVVVDDADLPLGTLRMRPSGSSGGHHGLESIEQHLGTRAFARLRVGIGRTADGRREITRHVLGRFSADEHEWVLRVLDRAAAQIRAWIECGLAKAMNEFNGAIDAPNSKTSE